jgi:protein gp37
MTDQRDGGIAWTDETWNPVRGCSDVNQDCIHCYAKHLAATRLSGAGQAYHGLAEMRNGRAYWTGKVDLIADKLPLPLRWTRPRKVFVNAMSDLFHEALTAAQIDQVVAVMALADRHTFQVLTKRPKRMALYLQDISEGAGRERFLEAIQRAMGYVAPSQRHRRFTPHLWPLRNVWWGASMGHQAAADAFGPDLLHCRAHATVLWVSAEPLTERVTLRQVMPTGRTTGIDWLVVGGESLKGARPMHPRWATALQQEAEDHGVQFLLKQWGEWAPKTYVDQDGQALVNISCDGKTERVVSVGPDDHSDDVNMVRVGKRAAGRILNGRLWNQWPRQAIVSERIN